MAQISRWKHHR